MLKLYNTLSRKFEVFKPLKDKEVRMYTCGPTVYDYAHIGNFRAYICADILKRYLKYKGYKVKHVMNITDIDDKTIKGSQEQGISLKGYTEKYTQIFFEDIKTLRLDLPDTFPKATEHIPEMIRIIKRLLQNGYAYKAEDGSVYYSISKFEDYGKLAHLDFKGLKEGARVRHDSYTKESVSDFSLWKAYDKDDGDIFWETDLGKGRPGWHIECSAMNMKYLGEEFDIHTGGVDLIFPHHENEIAQSVGSTGKKFVHFWVHNEHLLVDGKKMSKSLGNFYTLQDLLNKNYNPRAIRYLLFSTHYRQQLNFTEEALQGAEHAIQRIDDFILKLKEQKGNKPNKKITELISKTRKGFEKSMDNDLNISEALSHLFEFIKQVNIIINENNLSKTNAEKILEFLKNIDTVLGILEFKEETLDEEIKKLISERESARKARDFENADEIRNLLKEKGIVLEDTPTGTRWKRG